jgi:hypothetical protein
MYIYRSESTPATQFQFRQSYGFPKRKREKNTPTAAS